MEFVGLYNFRGGGTEVVIGSGDENVPSIVDVVSNDPKIFLSGQFTNLSMELIHVTLKVNIAGGSPATFHKHDLRPRESLNMVMIPIKEIAVHIGSTNMIGLHGMGVLWKAQDEDEFAVMGSKSSLLEGGSVPATFNTDSYTRVTTSTATTGDLVASTAGATGTDFALSKVIIGCAAANVVSIFWTDAGNSNISFIGAYHFGAAGTFVLDCDWLRNPNRQGGKLRYTTTTTGATTIDVVGHLVAAGQ